MQFVEIQRRTLLLMKSQRAVINFFEWLSGRMLLKTRLHPMLAFAFN